MASGFSLADDDFDLAVLTALRALITDRELDSVITLLRGMHRPQHTFPAEVLLELAAEAIEESHASSSEPIQYEGMRDRYLPDYDFYGTLFQHKSHYALMAAAMTRAGVYPDPLNEAYGWGSEDMWEYAFYAMVLYIRVAAERTGRSPRAVAEAIAQRRGIDLDSLEES